MPKPECIRQWCAQQFGIIIRPGRPLPELRHSFTHFDLDIRPFPVTVTDAAPRIVDAGAQIWYNRPLNAEHKRYLAEKWRRGFSGRGL